MDKYLSTRTCKLDANGNGVDICEGVVIIFEAMNGANVKLTWLDGGQQESGSIGAAVVGRKYNAGSVFEGLKFSGGQANDTLTYLVGPEGADSYNILAAAAVIGHVIVDNEVEIKNDVGNPVPVNGTITVAAAPVGSAHVNAKKTATNASAAALAANAARKYLSMQNPSDTEYVYFRTDGGSAVADATSHKLYPGQSYEPRVAPVGAINIIRGGAVNVDITVTEG